MTRIEFIPNCRILNIFTDLIESCSWFWLWWKELSSMYFILKVSSLGTSYIVFPQRNDVGSDKKSFELFKELRFSKAQDTFYDLEFVCLSYLLQNSNKKGTATIIIFCFMKCSPGGTESTHFIAKQVCQCHRCSLEFQKVWNSQHCCHCWCCLNQSKLYTYSFLQEKNYLNQLPSNFWGLK